MKYQDDSNQLVNETSQKAVYSICILREHVRINLKGEGHRHDAVEEFSAFPFQNREKIEA